MPINISLLSNTCEAPGVPGYESKIRDLIINEVTPLVDDISVDNMGNVFALKKGNRKP